jgi:hypothetical protein
MIYTAMRELSTGQSEAEQVRQLRKAIKRRDVDGETLRSIGRRYSVSPQTISRLSI